MVRPLEAYFLELLECPSQPGERIEQDHHVLARLDHPARPFHREQPEGDVLPTPSSLLEARTVAGTLRLKSVTSSGRSSIRSATSSTSGWLCLIPKAMFWSRIVLPALGGATIRPRVPNPIGQNRSISRQAGGQPSCSRLRRGCGSIGVSSRNSSWWSIPPG